MITQELREIMAELGFRTVNEMVGQFAIWKEEKILNIGNIKIWICPILYKEPTSMYSLYKQKDRIMD